MTLTYSVQHERFEVVSSFGERTVPRAAGFRWDKERRRWWTKDTITAAHLSGCADKLAEPRLRKVLASVVQSRSDNAVMAVPAPDGLAYLPYQIAGVRYALGREGTLIGDDMGLGKTIQAIGIINARNARHVLVYCPYVSRAQLAARNAEMAHAGRAAGVDRSGPRVPGGSYRDRSVQLGYQA